MSYQWEPPDLLGPLLKGLQIRSYLEDIKARREERALRAETHRMNIEAHRQDQAVKKFEIQRTLAESGFLPAATTDTGANDELVAAAVNITPENRRSLLDAPGIGRFRAPSQMDRFRRAQTFAEQEGTVAGIKERAKAAVTAESYIPMDFGEFGSFTIPRSQLMEGLKLKRDLKANKYAAHDFTTDDEGNTVFVGIPQGGGEPVKIPLGPIGKSARATAAGGLTPHQQFQQEHTLKQESRAEQKDISDTVDKAQALINKATQVDETFAADQRPDPNMSPEWKAARVAAEQAAQRYPDAIEAGVDANGYPYVKAKERVTPATVAPTIKPGDKRLVRGKLMTITKVYPDGSFDAK